MKTSTDSDSLELIVIKAIEVFEELVLNSDLPSTFSFHGETYYSVLEYILKNPNLNATTLSILQISVERIENKIIEEFGKVPKRNKKLRENITKSKNYSIENYMNNYIENFCYN